MKIAVASLIVLAVLSVNGVAQEYTRWGLPEGAKIRLGKGRITEIEFSPDGNLLAAASTIGIWLYDTETLQEVSLLTVSWGNVASIAFSPDGRTIAGGSRRGVHLWDVNSGEKLGTLPGHVYEANSLAFSPDGKTLFTADEGGTVLIWQHAAAPTAAGSTVSVWPTWVTSPVLGQQLSLSLTIAYGENVAGYQATVSFDPTALRYINSTVGAYLPARAFVLPSVVEEDRVTLGAMALDGEGRGNGRLAILWFEVLAVKTSRVKLFEVSLVDGDAKRTCPLLEDGRVVEPPR